MAANVNDFIIQGNHIGNVFSNQVSAATKYGIEIEAGTSNQYVVLGNTLIGNAVGGLSNDGTGTDSAVANNVGT